MTKHDPAEVEAVAIGIHNIAWDAPSFVLSEDSGMDWDSFMDRCAESAIAALDAHRAPKVRAEEVTE